MKIIAFDPGNSTGWAFVDTDTGVYGGGTICEDLPKIYGLMDSLEPDIVVYERFILYPHKAASMSWNSFYPCEVIGVIRLWCDRHFIAPIGQGADIKKYSGGIDERFQVIKDHNPKLVTEHTKDAYMHLKYYLKNKENHDASHKAKN